MRTTLALALTLAAGCAEARLEDSAAEAGDASPSMLGAWGILAPFPVYYQLDHYTLRNPASPAWPLVTLELDQESILLGVDYETTSGGRSWALVDESPNDCEPADDAIACTILGEPAVFRNRNGGWEVPTRSMAWGDAVYGVTSIAER